MVQSEVEVVKLNSLFQKVLYKWLEGRRFPQFIVRFNSPSYDIHANNSSLVVTTFRGEWTPKSKYFNSIGWELPSL